jgi:hypothetical protein
MRSGLSGARGIQRAGDRVNIPDPFGRELSFFRSVRDSIQRQVVALLNDLDRSAEGEQADSAEVAG